MGTAVYHIVRVSGRTPAHLDKTTRAVIASGFLHASEAREGAFRWVDRYFPGATYQADRDRWWIQEAEGSGHLFTIEPHSTTRDLAR